LAQFLLSFLIRLLTILLPSKNAFIIIYFLLCVINFNSEPG